VRPKVDPRAGGWPILSAAHKNYQSRKMELKHKTDEQVSPVIGLEP